MKLVKIKLLTKITQTIYSEKGIEVNGEVYKAKKEDGMVTIELPEERAVRLLSSSDAESYFELLSPESIVVKRRRSFGTVDVILQSKAAKASESAPKNKEALNKELSLKERYEALDWEEEQFKNFCEENNIEVPGNWGKARMIKELVALDSELTTSLADYLK